MKKKLKHFYIVLFFVSLIVTTVPEIQYTNLILEILAQYRVQIMAVIFIMAFIFLITRHYILAFLQVLCAVFTLFILLNSYEVPLKSAVCSNQNQTQSLKLLSFNVYYKNDHYQEILKTLQLVDADVIFMVEVQSDLYHASHKQLLAKYPFYYSDLEKGIAHGKAIYSKYEILNTENKIAGKNKRNALHMQINIDGQILDFIGVHMASPQSDERIDKRNNQIIELMAYINSIQNSDNLMIVAGDFNTAPWIPVMRQFKQKTEFLNNQITNVKGTWPAWLPAVLRVPIDNIYYSQQFINSNYNNGLASNSDHYPIYVNLNFCK